MSALLRLLVCALACACACDAYKVLVIFPFPGRSHGILGEGVVRHLLNAGHEVTYITPFVKEKAHPKLRQVDISGGTHPTVDVKAIMDNTSDMFDVSLFFNMTVGTFQEAFVNQNVQRLLNDPQQTFDLVIAEWMFTELYSGFATVYNCPFVWVSTVEPHSTILRLIDEPLNPAYHAGIISVETPPYNFQQRVKELLISTLSSLMKKLVFDSVERTEFKERFGPLLKKRGLPVPDFEDVRYNVSLVLGNSHVSLGQATRLPANYIAIGGYHIDPEVKPLPEDLKKLLDTAKHGLIYFSLGSNIKSKDLPDQVKKDLLKMFGTLKQTVLWKFEEVLPDLPPNVHIISWAPQAAILSHPNCILFITHGGLLSSSETIYFGKATVGVPVFADQFSNVNRAVQKGYGVRVDLTYNIAADLKIAIEEVVRNPSYSKRAKELSFVFHHRPVPPGTELVHWVEHVIKTNGAPHLRSPALSVPFYQKCYLDLVAVVVAIVLALKSIFKFVASRLCKRKKPSSSSSKKNK